MKHYQNNGINILLKKMPKTPRMSVSFFFKIDKKEKFYGVNSLLARLLLQGTKTYNAVELALAFENECIDITTKAKQDYLKFSLVFLNEDFKRAMELVKDLILNSTLDDFEKEVYKLKDIQRYCKTKILAKPIPTMNDVTQAKLAKIMQFLHFK